MAVFCQQFAKHAKTSLHSAWGYCTWQFNNLAYSSGLMFGWVISTIAFRALLVRIGDLNTILFQLDRCQTQMCSVFHRLEQRYVLGSLLFVFHQWVWCKQGRPLPMQVHWAPCFWVTSYLAGVVERLVWKPTISSYR